MVTRIFLCNERSEPDIRTFISEAMEDMADGEPYIITWNCGNVQTVKVGDRAYFKRIGSPVQGYFACGQVVAADREYQLKLKSNRYSELSEAYDVDMYDNSLRVWVAWDSCVDFDQPLASSTLRELPQFQGMPLEPQTEGGVFREEYVRLLDREWDRHSFRQAKTGTGLRLVDVYYRWGKEDTEEGVWEEAINSFTQAIRLRPNLVKAYIARADVYINLKKYPEAIADLGQAIYLQPDKVKEAYYKRGLAQLKLGQNEQALTDLNKAIAIDPNYLEALFALGNSYFKLKSFEQAISTYSQVIAIDPAFGNSYYRRGRSYFILKEFESAIRDFQSAIKIEPSLADAYYYRGVCQSQPEIAQETLAYADLQQSIRLYREQGKADKAGRALELLETLKEAPIDRSINTLPERKIFQISEGSSKPKSKESFRAETLMESGEDFSPQDNSLGNSLGNSRASRQIIPETSIDESTQNLAIPHPDQSAEIRTEKFAQKTVEKVIILNVGERSAKEKAALVAVTTHYAQNDWQVSPMDKNTCGYDLQCVRGEEQEQVLIKDVPDASAPFVLNATEINSARTCAGFVLWLVSQEQERTICQQWRGEEVLAKFQIEPLEYVVKPKAESADESSRPELLENSLNL